MSTQKNFITLCIATVFTLGLAACGGGGGSDAPPASGMMDDVGSLEGKYIPSGTEIRGVDAPNGTTLTAANGVEVTIPGVGTVECASEGGCSGTVEDGVVTITGDLKIVSVDPALDSATATVLAGLAVDMLPTEQPTPMVVAIPDAMYLDADNMPMAGMTMIAPGASYTSGGVMFSCPADGDACDLEIAADGSATSTGGMAEAMLTDAAILQIAQAKMDAKDKAAAATLELRDRIIGKVRALERAANILQTTTGTTPNMLEEDDITISRADGAMASVTVADPTGFSPDADPALPNSGWADTHLSRTVAGVGMQHLFVYTDIEEPTKIQFYDFDADSTTEARYPDPLNAPTEDGNENRIPYAVGDPITGLMLTDGASGNFSAAVADPARFPAPLSAEEGSDIQLYSDNTDTEPMTNTRL